jgi:hypothetical protein
MLWASFWLAWTVGAPAQFLISEFSASNQRVIRDRYGDFSDWIELVNTSTATQDLAGWRLTDSSSNLSKWVFPSTNISPGGYIVVFASGRDRRIPGEELHTNFELKKDGEYLALVTPSGAIAHEFAPTYPAQITDVSYGLLTGATTNWLLTTNSLYRYYVPTNNTVDGKWIWWGFDDSQWSNGIGGIGYDTSGVYNAWIQTSVSNQMFGRSSSVYIRVPFLVDNPERIRKMNLEIEADDAFVAYINGQEVARTNINTGTGAPSWNTQATGEWFVSSSFPVSRAYKRLVVGTNWLGIHLINRSRTNMDAFARFSLVSFTDQLTTGLTPYAWFTPPSPGQLNDFTRAIRGPLIEWATDRAIGVQTGATMAVTARVTRTFHPVVTNDVRVYWRVMFGPENVVVLRDDGVPPDPVAGDGIYHGSIPTTTLGINQMIRWRYEVRDVSNNVTRLPAYVDFADSPKYFGAVAEDPNLVTGLPVFYWYCENVSMAETELGTRTCVYFLSNFYDNVSVDLHGQSSEGFPIKSHNFDFNTGYSFLYAVGQRKVTDIDLLSTWADKSKCRNIMAYDSFTRFGHPAHFVIPVRVHRNGPFWTIGDLVEDGDDRFLQRVGLNPEGALYKMYNSLTDWWPGVPGSESGAEKKNRRFEGNDDLRDFIQGLSQTAPGALARFVFDHVDVVRAINYFAVMAITQDHDHGHKNYYLYRDTTGTGEWMILPQDADLTFGHVWNSSNGYFETAIVTNHAFPFNYTSANRLFSFFMTNNVTKSMFLRRVRTLLDRTLAPGATFYTEWIATITNQLTADYADFYAKWRTTKWGSQTNWETMVEEANRIMQIFLPGRYTYIVSRPDLPPSQPRNVQILFGRLDVNPLDGDQDREFIELVNTNMFAVDISDWSLSNAVSFKFPGGTVIPAGGSLFVSPNKGAFRLRSTSPKSNELALVTGPYIGYLSAWGESVELWNDAGTLVAVTNYPAAPSVWQRQLRITEIMYDPPDAPGSPYPDAWNYEWLELANLGTNALDLLGVAITQGISFRFDQSTVLGPRERVVIAKNPAAFATRYDTNGVRVVGPFNGLLDNSGERLALADPNGETILEFRYEGTWEPSANGRGWSIVHTNPAASPMDWGAAQHWTRSPAWMGTPGRGEFEWPVDTVVIHEWLAHSDIGQDWVEIRNLSSTAIDISGWWMSDSLTQLKKFVIPSGTVILPGGFAVFTEAQFNNPAHPGCRVPFALSELGEELHLTAATNGVSMSYRHSLFFGASDRNVTFGRHRTSDGRVLYPALSQATPGAPNAAPLVGPITITEILYAPDTNGLEFIELYNLTATNVPLFDLAAPTNTWRITGAIRYVFPTNVVVAPGEYILVTESDPATFRARYGLPNSIQVLGPWEGRLNNAGDIVRLRKPGPPELSGFVPDILVEEIEYDDTWPWPPAGRLGGRSIEKVRPYWFGNDPDHWRAGVPRGTPGQPCSSGDANADGIPDEWEIAVFGDAPPSPPSDRDGDGQLDVHQYIAGTIASSNSSVFMLVLERHNPPTVRFETRVSMGPGYQGRQRWYALEATTSLVSGVWAPVPGFERIPATGQMVVATNLPTGSGLRAVRVRVWLEDRD